MDASLLEEDGAAGALDRRDPIERLHGVGPRRLSAYRTVGIRRIVDLLRFAPRRYVGYATPTPLAACVRGQIVSVRATCRRVTRGKPGRKRTVTRLSLEDDSGRCDAVLFGPAWMADRFQVGEDVLLRVVRETERDTLTVRDVWREALPGPGDEAWVADYALPSGIPARAHRGWVAEALRRAWPMLRRRRLRSGRGTPDAPSLADVLRWLHLPSSQEEIDRVQRLLAFEDAVQWQSAILRLRSGRNRRTRGFGDLDRMFQRYARALPFGLTDDQARSVREIARDLAGPTSMVRLLTGDVGSGKTAVSFFPVIAAILAGRQAAVLAPTELLARQHHAALIPVLQRLDLAPPALMAGAARRRSTGGAAAVVGTHRLMGTKLDFDDLAVVVVDEQHKFGVRQRIALWSKGQAPDLLTVSATPIPRTLARVALGYFDHSRLGPRPGAVRQVVTSQMTGEARRRLPDLLNEEVARGGRAFVVCPAVGTPGTPREVRGMAAAEEVAPWFDARLSSARVGLLHGRMDPEEKAERLRAFTEGEVQVLVSTVVIEVGIDVPDATLVVVLDATRFGLAQLHQIRGRVGRRGQPARCVLVAGDPGPDAQERLDAFCGVEDGAALAELDLERRGPGEILGLRQHGMVASPSWMKDEGLVAEARMVAERNLAQDR